MKMLADLELVCGGYFSGALRKQAESSLALANKSLSAVPFLMRRYVERSICWAFEDKIKKGLMIGDAYKALSSKARSFLEFEGVAGLKMSASSDDFEDAAERLSKSCEKICRGMLRYAVETSEVDTLEKRHAFLCRIQRELASVCDNNGVLAPALKKNPSEKQFASASRRMMCPKWWKRQIGRTHARWLESIAIKHGFVGSHVGAAYVSNTALEEYRNRRRRNRAILEGLEVFNEDLDLRLNLIDCVDASVSNPKNRRNETMMRLRGLEEWADACPRCWSAQFWTCTVPSRFHKWSGQRDNPKYNYESPRDAQHWLCAVWARVRAELKRRNIDFSGVRIAEPHHDGCPHWHVLIFASHDDLKIVESVMRDYLIYGESFGSELEKVAREENGFDVENIDKSKGSAVGYVAKYISKHIDGKGWGSDDVDNDSGLMLIDQDCKGDGDRPEAIDRVLAWATIWGIRQFQFFSAGKVTSWREIRRIKEKPADESPLLDAWQSANNEDNGGASKACWRSFLEAAEKNPIEIVSDVDVSMYGDEQKMTLGIECGGVFYMTRDADWKICKKASPWTRDNNCTTRETVFVRKKKYDTLFLTKRERNKKEVKDEVFCR